MRKVNMQQSLRLGLIRSISLHPTIWNQAIADPKNETKHRGQYAWLSTKGQFLIQKKIRYWCPWKIFWIKSIWIILSPLSLTQISKSAWTKKNLKMKLIKFIHPNIVMYKGKRPKTLKKGFRKNVRYRMLVICQTMKILTKSNTNRKMKGGFWRN